MQGSNWYLKALERCEKAFKTQAIPHLIADYFRRLDVSTGLENKKAGLDGRLFAEKEVKITGFYPTFFLSGGRNHVLLLFFFFPAAQTMFFFGSP